MAIISNVDNKLNDDERRRHERDERNTAIVQEAYDQSEDYGYRGAFNPRGNIITETQDKWSYADVMRRKHEGKPIIPTHHFIDKDGDVMWVLADEDAAAVESGYVCENCLVWQGIPNAAVCNWERGGSCGYRNY